MAITSYLKPWLWFELFLSFFGFSLYLTYICWAELSSTLQPALCSSGLLVVCELTASSSARAIIFSRDVQSHHTCSLSLTSTDSIVAITCTLTFHHCIAGFALRLRWEWHRRQSSWTWPGSPATTEHVVTEPSYIQSKKPALQDQYSASSAYMVVHWPNYYKRCPVAMENGSSG